MGFAKYNEDNARLLLERNLGRDSDITEMGWGGAFFCRSQGGREDTDRRPAQTQPLRSRPVQTRPHQPRREASRRTECRYVPWWERRRRKPMGSWTDQQGRTHFWTMENGQMVFWVRD